MMMNTMTRMWPEGSKQGSRQGGHHKITRPTPQKSHLSATCSGQCLELGMILLPLLLWHWDRHAVETNCMSSGLCC
jgi:hypothetical protein